MNNTSFKNPFQEMKWAMEHRGCFRPLWLSDFEDDIDNLQNISQSSVCSSLEDKHIRYFE